MSFKLRYCFDNKTRRKSLPSFDVLQIQTQYSVTEEISLNTRELPQCFLPQLIANSLAGLLTYNFHPSFRKLSLTKWFIYASSCRLGLLALCSHLIGCYHPSAACLPFLLAFPTYYSCHAIIEVGFMRLLTAIYYERRWFTETFC